jgi:choline-sulfatase
MVKESGPIDWSYQHDYDEETHYRALAALRGLAQRRGPDKDQPWFLCVSYTHPHDPYVNLAEYWDRYEGREIATPDPPPPGWQPHVMDVWTNSYHGVDVVAPTPDDVCRSRRGYYASTGYFDDKLGGLLDELERLDLAGDTLALVTADHGDMCGERGMWFKRTVREWAARVPLVVVGAGVATGRRVPQNVSLVDLFPTMLDLAGIEPETGFSHPLDGRSLFPFLRGETPADWPDEAFVENFGEATIAPIRSLTKGRYKFIYVHGQPDQLHDIDADPHEWRNLADDPAHAGVAREMRARALAGWDPAETDRLIRESQHRRAFLKEALFQGTYTPWDFQPFFDGARQYVRRWSNQQWDPHLGH